jgi:hypothetical protein
MSLQLRLSEAWLLLESVYQHCNQLSSNTSDLWQVEGHLFDSNFVR